MSCWEILGIAQTFDLTAIKTAYASKAKEWHPEEHPEEFQRLQQAYRNAVRMAKLHQTKTYKDVRPVHTMAESRYDVVRQKKEANQEALSTETVEKEELPNASTEKEETVQTEIIQKATADQSQDFDYEEVEKVDLKDRFFQEFFSIAWNPYLMNNLICWEYILKRSHCEQLLSDSAFRRNFVLTVCHQLTGWQRGTILFFEKWLQSHPVRDADRTRKKETDLLCWKLRKIGLFEKLISTQSCATNEQKQLHEIFLTQVERSGLNTSLKSEEDLECYLSFYLPYAAEKQSRIKQLYQGSCQGRAMFTSLLLMVPIIIGMVIYVQVCVVPQMEERKAKEAGQQRVQQYNESLQNSDITNAQQLEEH